MVTKFSTHYNYDATKFPGKIPGTDGMTVPEQALSISELFSRYTRGLPIPSALNMGFSDVDTTPYDNLDKLQKMDAARSVARTAKQLESDANAILEKGRQKLASDDFQRAVAEAAAKLNVPPKTDLNV